MPSIVIIIRPQLLFTPTVSIIYYDHYLYLLLIVNYLFLIIRPQLLPHR